MRQSNSRRHDDDDDDDDGHDNNDIVVVIDGYDVYSSGVDDYNVLIGYVIRSLHPSSLLTYD